VVRNLCGEQLHPLLLLLPVQWRHLERVHRALRRHLGLSLVRGAARRAAPEKPSAVPGVPDAAPVVPTVREEPRRVVGAVPRAGLPGLTDVPTEEDDGGGSRRGEPGEQQEQDGGDPCHVLHGSLL